MIRTEIRRVFRSRAFYLACVLMLAYAYYDTSDEFRHLLNWGFLINRLWQIKFLHATGDLLPFLCPLTVALPYVLSYRKERDSGYRQLMVLKTSPGAYRRAKLLSVAASGAAAVCIPLLCWMLVCRLLGTGRTDYPIEMESSMVQSYMKPLFEGHINVYVFLYLINISLAGAVFALLGLGISAVIRSRYLAVLFPFGFCIFSAIVLDPYDKGLNAFKLAILGDAYWENIYGPYGHILFLAFPMLLGIGLFIGGDLYAEKA